MKYRCCLDAARDHQWLIVEKMIQDGYPMHPQLTTYAASQGQKWVLEMLMEYGCVWDSHVLYAAALNDYQLCFNYAFDNGATLTVSLLVDLINQHQVKPTYFGRVYELILASSDNTIDQDFIPLLEATATRNLLHLVKQLHTYKPSLFQDKRIKDVIVTCLYPHRNALDCAMFLVHQYLLHHPFDSQLLNATFYHDMYLPYTSSIIHDVFTFAPTLSQLQQHSTFTTLRVSIPIEHKHKIDTHLLYNINDCITSLWYVNPQVANVQTVWLLLSYYTHFRHQRNVNAKFVRYLNRFITVELYLKHLDILDLIVQDHFQLSGQYSLLVECYQKAAALTGQQVIQTIIPACVVAKHISPFFSSAR